MMEEGMGEEMPMKAADISAKNKGATESTVGKGAPMAVEPLEPMRLNALVDAVNEAMRTITNGEVPLEVQPVQDPQDKIPDDLFTALVALGALSAKLGAAGEPYMINPAQMGADNNGLVDMAETILAMTSDPKVLSALRGSAPDLGGKKKPKKEKEPSPGETEDTAGDAAEDDLENLAK